MLDSHGTGAGLPLSSLHGPGPHTTGTIDLCSLWASPAPLATATWAGDTSWHLPHSMVPSCAAEEVDVSSPPFSPASPLLCPGPAWPPSKGRWVLGSHPLAGSPKAWRLKCSQAGLGSSSVQVSGTQGTSPNPSCSCRPPASHRAGRAVASWPPAPREKAHRERRWDGGAGSREAAWLGGEAAGLRDCFLLGPDKAVSIAPAGKGQCCHLAACLQLTVLHRSLPPVAEHGTPAHRGHEATRRDCSMQRGLPAPPLGHEQLQSPSAR